MAKKTVLVLGLLAASLLAAPAAIARERTPEGSFLRFRANTVNELRVQVAKDSVARTRYAKHFGIPNSAVGQAMKGDMKLVTLKKPTRVQMWFVSKRGTLHSKTKLLPKGSYVFADAEGKPFLAWSCGNPLRATLPSPRVAKKPVTNATAGAAGGLTHEGGPVDTIAEPVTTAQDAFQTAAVETKVLPAPVEVMTQAAITAPPTLLTQAAAIDMAVAPALAATAIPAAAAVAPAIAAASSAGSLLGWIGGLAGAAGAAAAIGGGGDGGNKEIPSSVPEPGSVIALVAGLSSVGVAAYRGRFIK